MGIISFFGNVIDWNRGIKNVLGSGRWAAGRERAYMNRDERLGVREHKLKAKRDQAVSKGNPKELSKALDKLAMVEIKEGKLVLHTFDREDQVDYFVIEEIGKAIQILNQIKAKFKGDMIRRASQIEKMLQQLMELEEGKMNYLMQGGKPWEGASQLIGLDMQSTENVVIQQARKLRRIVTIIMNSIKLINKYAESIRNEESLKASRIAEINKDKEKMGLAMNKLEDIMKEFREETLMQFYCSLRLLSFMREEFNAEENLFDYYHRELGLDSKDAERFKKLFEEDIKTLEKQESVEANRLMKLASEAARRKAA